MSGYGTPRITSDWTPADGSENRLEFAQTEYTPDKGILAMRSSTNRDAVIPVTVQQIKNLPNALSQGGALHGLVNF
jgi:hypothetical protein